MVLYFSGTGNSRYVAQKIAEMSDDEVISINQRLKKHNYSTVSSEKPLVFVGPIYAGRFPRVMDDYIKEVSFTETNCAYFIGTCAQTPWVTVEYVEKLCKEKSFSLLGFNSIIMPQGYVAGGGTQPKEINDKILKEAEPKITSAKNFKVTNQCTGCGKCEKRCPLNNIKLTDGKPTWGKNCTHCMACIAGCPQEAIEYGKKTQGKPRYYLGDK